MHNIALAANFIDHFIHSKRLDENTPNPLDNYMETQLVSVVSLNEGTSTRVAASLISIFTDLNPSWSKIMAVWLF